MTPSHGSGNSALSSRWRWFSLSQRRESCMPLPTWARCLSRAQPAQLYALVWDTEIKNECDNIYMCLTLQNSCYRVESALWNGLPLVKRKTRRWVIIHQYRYLCVYLCIYNDDTGWHADIDTIGKLKVCQWTVSHGEDQRRAVWVRVNCVHICALYIYMHAETDSWKDQGRSVYKIYTLIYVLHMCT